MRLAADANISPAIVAWLRNKGHDVWHGTEHGLANLPDRDLFALAERQQRVVLTFDLDFGEILAFSAGATSAITLRLRLRRTLRVIERLATVLPVAEAALRDGPVIVLVEDSRHRVRSLPISGSGRAEG